MSYANSSSLKVGLSLTGGQKRAFYARGTNAYFLEQSSLSCLPFGIDDPNMSTYAGKKQLDVGELVVDLHNGTKTANLRSGALQPSSAPLIATNNPPKDDPYFSFVIPRKSPAARCTALSLSCFLCVPESGLYAFAVGCTDYAICGEAFGPEDPRDGSQRPYAEAGHKLVIMLLYFVCFVYCCLDGHAYY